MDKIKNNILKFAIMPAFIICMVFLVGCSTATNNTLNTISLNMDTVINSINQIETINAAELIIDDFMNLKDLSYINNDNEWTTYNTSNAMATHITKLTLLNNAIYNAICVNDNILNYKKQIVAKSHQVKSLCEQCADEKNTISKDNLDTLEELNSIVMSNNNRATLTRNEVKNNLAQIQKIKHEYSSKTEQLSSRYQNLESSLNTRLSYYVNILNCLDNMSNIISCNCTCYDLKTLEETENNQVITTTNGTTNNGIYEHNKMYRKKNIDTYEYSGKDVNGFNKNDKIISNDNYLNNYGYNYYPSGIGNGYRMGINGPFPYGMYGYGMGMPFGIGGFGGYTYPNINTFGTYKNIDTYKIKPMPKPYESKDENKKDNLGEETTKTASNFNDVKELNPKSIPELLEQEKHPNPKPFIPERPFKKRIQNKDELNNKIDENFSINTNLNDDDGEDKFVKIKPNIVIENNEKPKIERLQED